MEESIIYVLESYKFSINIYWNARLDELSQISIPCSFKSLLVVYFKIII